mmetsp:Transcript_9566/g.28912  ORF Transcript_9566/g.28912 Transcript_9566/m.28912 type:complete len:262 (-) Transcript_9566:25-810(-)
MKSYVHQSFADGKSTRGKSCRTNAQKFLLAIRCRRNLGLFTSFAQFMLLQSLVVLGKVEQESLFDNSRQFPVDAWRHRNEVACLVLVLSVFGIRTVFAVVSALRNVDSGAKEQSEHGEQWAQNCHPPPRSVVDANAGDEQAPPEKYIAKVVGMSRVLPEADITPVALAFLGVLESGLLNVSNHLDGQADAPEDVGNDFQGSYARAVVRTVDSNGHKRDDEVPHELSDPETSQLQWTTPQLVEPVVLSPLENSKQQKQRQPK